MMKNRMMKFLKKTISVFVVCTIVACGFSITTHATTYTETKSEDEKMHTQYVKYEFSDFKQLRDDDEIPVYSDVNEKTNGYLFGGWFTSNDGHVFTALTKEEKVAKDTGDVYAKFVPAYVMGVKCQNQAGTKSGEGPTMLKIVSAIDTGNYSSVGFEMDIITLKADGSFDTEKLIADKTGIQDAYKRFKVYDSMDATEPAETYEANELFGNEAGYFTTWGVTEIPHTMYEKIICIRPSWTTIDGTTVYGLTKYARVNDGIVFEEDGAYYRYLSVPVNVRDTVGGIAAGVLSVTYPETLTFVGFEGGRVFEEMAAAEKTNSIKMVGNVADISKNKTVDDIYANLRFKVSFENAKKASATLKDYDFTVTGEDFSNVGETQFDKNTYNVWDVKY